MNPVLKSVDFKSLAAPLRALEVHVESTAPFTGVQIFRMEDYLTSKKTGRPLSVPFAFARILSDVRQECLKILNPTVWSDSKGDDILHSIPTRFISYRVAFGDIVAVELDPTVAADAVCLAWFVQPTGN